MDRTTEETGRGWTRRAAEYFAIDLRTLACVRIYLGSFILIDLLLRSRTIAALLSDDGLVPRTDLLAIPPLFSVYSWSGSPGVQALLMAVHALVVLLFLVGWRTRIVTVIAFILQGSIIARNPFMAGGEDIVPLQILLWSMFLPLGARWSLDARAGRDTTGLRSSRVLSVAAAALTLQFVFLYVTGGLVKSGVTWQDNTALLITVSPDTWALPFGRLLRRMPDLLAIMTPATLVLELFVPLLIFVPWRNALMRWIVILSFVLFQFGLWISVELRLFPFMSTALALVLVPGSTWDWLHERTGKAWLRVSGSDTGDAATARAPTWQNRVVAVLLFFAFMINVLTTARTREMDWLAKPLQPFEDVGAQIGVFQRWDMYGPDPGLREIRTKLEGVTLKGRSIMLLDESGGDAWEQAILVHSIYRVRFYLEKLFSSTYRGSPLIERYQAWSCLQWNDGAAEGDRIIRIRRIGLFRNLREGPDAKVRRVNGPWQACPRG